MKKQIITVSLALMLMLMTVYAAMAQENGDDAPQIIIDEIANRTNHVGETLTLNIADSVTYTGDDNLTYTLLSNVPEMTLNETTGVLNYLPEFKEEHTQNHEVRIRVENTTGASEDAFFYVNVTDNNFDMVITSTPKRTAEVEEKYTYEPEITISHPEAISEDGYTIELKTAPEGMVIAKDGTITWTPTTEQFGTHDVEIITKTLTPYKEYNKTQTYTINLNALTIDRVEVESSSRRLETISRANYLSSSLPYLIARDASLGDTIELSISIRNNLPTGTDNEIRDVELEIYSWDLEAADGLDAYISRIRSGRVEDSTITFELDATDLHPDDSPFDIEISIIGESRDGDVYEDLWELELELESKSYDLLILDPTINPTSVCPGQNLRLNYELRNIGTRDLSTAGIRYYDSTLGVTEWDRTINIDYDDSRMMNKVITIPDDATPGENMLEITSFPRLGSTSDTRTEVIMYTIRNCATQEEEEEEEEEPIIPPPQQDVLVPGTPVERVEGTKTTSIFDAENPMYLVILTALAILLLIGVILLFIQVLKK